jgi:hypothetical protein
MSGTSAYLYPPETLQARIFGFFQTPAFLAIGSGSLGVLENDVVHHGRRWLTGFTLPLTTAMICAA